VSAIANRDDAVVFWKIDKALRQPQLLGRRQHENDENFVVIRKNIDLALEYAAHILAVYEHHRWQRHLKGAAKEIEFWAR
jgi:adenylate kinase family enzyme